MCLSWANVVTCERKIEIDYLTKYIDIKFKYKLNHDYVFYPAQFWSHKNHIYLLLIKSCSSGQF